ncbi:Fe-S cluster assembly protein SufD [Novosphingobium kunmingense]|uniref:Fe-S cluster assembly protein SufD n=1 Tax=Novosphingobium kunmingense TaxID=1211806 RepID=A0A2N0H4V9_9SPHN|nr:SufD family Fe-S cluster assembly protein [Novosphingobium kunmingense]PKB13966.1 Fe-S cluster assembly protein SufD [Novosphingobium kunmingense]
MPDALTLPTRRDEDYRYADLGALAAVWPLAPETIVVPAGESRRMTVVQTGDAPQVRDLAIDLGEGATFTLHVLTVGAASARIAVTVRLAATAAFHLGAAQLAGAGATAEIVTRVVHAAPNAVSRQVVRSVAAAGGTVNYLGKVLVEKGADGTDGEQSVRAMLLDRTATANARPELEIHADDVKCAHGCAVGELDAQALFYMAQRGLPPELAKRLMLQAFVAEALVGAEDEEALQDQARAALEALL